ncbi:MAG: nucleotidyltransferase domain-containing protein [Candidatus Aenigmarchaeota archaeon]|nr:nucleotidyltransferase domain-containing protein [Candidatus Aenigmarchaeota archaeon]
MPKLEEQPHEAETADMEESNIEEGEEEAAETKKPKGRKKEGLEKDERIEILKKFAKAVLKKYGPLIRSVVLFGSTARQSFKKESDIDVFIILDDTRQRISPIFKEEIEEQLDIIARKMSKQLSLQQPYLLTEFWRLVRDGHPIIFNFIREGIPVYDRDIFLPIKRLLQMGEIKPSKEAVEKFIERGPKRVKRVENAKIYMVVEDCYYAMLESAQAVLMFLGKAPPRPGDAPEELRKSLVEPGLTDDKLIKYMEEIIQIRKEVEHKKRSSMPGQELDEWIKKTKEFVKEMQKLIVRIEILKRENMVIKSHAIMKETALTLFQALKLPEEKVKEEGMVNVFKKNLVETGLVSQNYLDTLSKLEEMKKSVKDGKVMDIPKQDILLQREYVRKFIREAGRVMKKKVSMGDGGE